MSVTLPIERVSEAARRAVLRELTAPARQSFLARFRSDAERSAYFRQMAQEREAVRRAARDCDDAQPHDAELAVQQ
jgi:hypothetical protein